MGHVRGVVVVAVSWRPEGRGARVTLLHSESPLGTHAPVVLRAGGGDDQVNAAALVVALAIPARAGNDGDLKSGWGWGVSVLPCEPCVRKNQRRVRTMYLGFV